MNVFDIYKSNLDSVNWMGFPWPSLLLLLLWKYKGECNNSNSASTKGGSLSQGRIPWV
jgi:hypothetical protein